MWRLYTRGKGRVVYEAVIVQGGAAVGAGVYFHFNDSLVGWVERGLALMTRSNSSSVVP